MHGTAVALAESTHLFGVRIWMEDRGQDKGYAPCAAVKSAGARAHALQGEQHDNVSVGRVPCSTYFRHIDRFALRPQT